MESYADRIRVLCVDADRAAETARALERETDRFSVESAAGASEALDRLGAASFDCVVSGLELPDGDALGLRDAVRAEYPDLPFVVFADAGSEQAVADALAAGVDDFVHRPAGSAGYTLLAKRVLDAVERGEREHRLERTSRRFDAVFDNPVSFMGILDLDGTVQRANETARAFGDVTAAEVEGEPFAETPWWNHSEAMQADLREWIDRAADGEFVRYEADHYDADGNRLTIDGTLYPVTDADGEPTAIVAAGRDVSERTEYERHLRRIHDVIADTDRSFDEQVGALLDIGRDALGTSYGTLSDVRGDEYVYEVVRSPDDSVRAGDTVPLSSTNCERSVATEQTLVLSNVAEDAPELTDRAGYTEQGISCYLGAPVSVDGEVYGTFCFYDDQPRETEFSEWDVTLVDLMSQWVGYELTRQRARERLERQNERLNEFASVVSHDLRNPLNVAQGRLEVATESCDSDHLDAVARSLDRMESLVEDLLALAREGEAATDPEPIEVADLAEASWRTVDTADATLSIETDRTVRADRGRLKQLLENLVRNAVEHGGTDERRPEGPEDAPERGGDGVAITIGDLGDGFYVEDDGEGIPADDREAAFEFGFSTARDGTGFGLAIVEDVAEAHGWSVSVTEGADGGARFEITGVE
ncbi:hybrid sensor histidine kinase/response regulator [Halorussus marinus]|uniref:hybrid sensor histidine kinase/response regulator n=1 Tax=Halorussus marinus TaxID=2505976 RepID=UPI0014320960|nr:ATP-binding protein [Halorussus marinus]